VCRATFEKGGPRRCSGDTRANYAQSVGSVAVLEKAEAALKSALDGGGAPPTGAGAGALSADAAASAADR
jgi:hypothetical protein